MAKKSVYLEFFNVESEEEKIQILNEELIKKEIIDDEESLVVELDLNLEEKSKELLELFEKYKDNIPSFYKYVEVPSCEKK